MFTIFLFFIYQFIIFFIFSLFGLIREKSSRFKCNKCIHDNTYIHSQGCQHINIVSYAIANVLWQANTYQLLSVTKSDRLEIVYICCGVQNVHTKETYFARLSLKISVTISKNDAAGAYSVRFGISRQNRGHQDPVEREWEAEDANWQQWTHVNTLGSAGWPRWPGQVFAVSGRPRGSCGRRKRLLYTVTFRFFKRTV